jgi:hypothetical protein
MDITLSQARNIVFNSADRFSKLELPHHLKSVTGTCEVKFNDQWASAQFSLKASNEYPGTLWTDDMESIRLKILFEEKYEILRRIGPELNMKRLKLSLLKHLWKTVCDSNWPGQFIKAFNDPHLSYDAELRHAVEVNDWPVLQYNNTVQGIPLNGSVSRFQGQNKYYDIRGPFVANSCRTKSIERGAARMKELLNNYIVKMQKHALSTKGQAKLTGFQKVQELLSEYVNTSSRSNSYDPNEVDVSVDMMLKEKWESKSHPKKGFSGAIDYNEDVRDPSQEACFELDLLVENLTAENLKNILDAVRKETHG